MNELSQNLLNQEQAIKHFLHDYANKEKGGQTIQNILADAGRYYDADRAYILEWNVQKTAVNNTYEWCREGVAAKRNALQNIPADMVEGWFRLVKERGEFFVSAQDEEFVFGSETYQILELRGIDSAGVAPLVVDGEIIGFFGVDNPKCNTAHLLLLSVISSTCCIEIANKRLEDSNKALEERMKIIQSLSEIYTLVYYIDLTKNYFTELSSVSDVRTHIGASGDAQERLNYFFHHMVTPDCTDELQVFVDLSTLEERLKNTRIISKQYRSTIFPSAEAGGSAASWGQCSFIEGNRDPEGRLTHVFFATQSIHGAKLQELEAKKKLQETNEELTVLLKNEKQHTSIIGSLSSIFNALYYIDMEENSYQERISVNNSQHVYSKKGNARECLKRIVKTHVAEESRPNMRIFTDLNTLDARLGEKTIIIQEYISVSGGWIRCAFIPVEKKADGRNKKVICTFRNITAEKATMETQDNLIQALAVSYENVYAINMNTGEAVCYRMGQTMSDRYGTKFAAGNYDRNLSAYIDNDVFEEDRHLFDDVRTVAGVSTLLEDKQAYYFNYRVFRNSEMQYFQCQIVKPLRERKEFAVAFKNIDEEKKKELAQQKKIEDALTAVERTNETLKDEMEIANALSKEYPDVTLINFEEDSATTLKKNGNLIPKDKRVSRHSYNTTWDYYISKYVVDEDKKKLKDAVSVQNVLRALEESDEYVCNYRVNYDESGTHYFQAVFIRIYFWAHIGKPDYSGIPKCRFDRGRRKKTYQNFGDTK